MKALPQDQRDRLLALADRWGQREIFSGDVDAALEALAKQVGDGDATDSERVDAAERLVRLADNAKTVDHILSQIDSRQSPALVQGLIEAVAASRQDATGEKLAARFAQITPASRRLAISVLLRRTAWTAALVDALESSAIGVGDVSDQAWQLLSSHRDANIAERAKKLAGRSIAANSDRQKVYESLLHVAKQTGDAELGRKVFEAKCAQCHRIDNVGKMIGPELTGIGSRAKHEILAEIIDPNRSVEANYRQWTAVTEDGLTITGLLIAESQTTVAILDAEAKRHVLERASLEELIPSTLSIMPVGLEKDLKPEDFAALLEFLSRSKVPHK
jgi:putative heme-binding domain-containing protein